MASKQKELDKRLGIIGAFVIIFHDICFIGKVKVVLVSTINEK